MMTDKSEVQLQQQQPSTVYRTTPARTGKMMAIMLGICIVGGAIFFAMWDFWISEPAPVVAMMAAESAAQALAEAGDHTGETIPVDLTFIEGDDFITMAFNELPGVEGNNPVINANVGDKIIFDVASTGVSFHAFGVTKNTEGFDGIIPGTDIGSMNSPLSSGDSGTSEFVPGEEGTYYYICTVPGHRAQGMEGMIVVGPAAEDSVETHSEPVTPTGVSHEFVLDFVESDDFITFGFDALPGEEGANPDIVVASGDEVTVSVVNKGISFHTFGVVDGPDIFENVHWDSAIGSLTAPLSAGQEGTVTFMAGAPGTYHYICTVPGHAAQGMQGNFIVE